jgi:hypothetical protein
MRRIVAPSSPGPVAVTAMPSASPHEPPVWRGIDDVAETRDEPSKSRHVLRRCSKALPFGILVERESSFVLRAQRDQADAPPSLEVEVEIALVSSVGPSDRFDQSAPFVEPPEFASRNAVSPSAANVCTLNAASGPAISPRAPLRRYGTRPRGIVKLPTGRVRCLAPRQRFNSTTTAALSTRRPARDCAARWRGVERLGGSAIVVALRNDLASLVTGELSAGCTCVSRASAPSATSWCWRCCS